MFKDIMSFDTHGFADKLHIVYYLEWPVPFMCIEIAVAGMINSSQNRGTGCSGRLQLRFVPVTLSLRHRAELNTATALGAAIEDIHRPRP